MLTAYLRKAASEAASLIFVSYVNLVLGNKDTFLFAYRIKKLNPLKSKEVENRIRIADR